MREYYALKDMELHEMGTKLMEASADDVRARAFFNTDKLSMTILEDNPRMDIIPSAAEYQEAVATILGAASPLCKNHIGKKICAVNDRQSSVVDGMGFNLTTVVGTKHQHRYALHNSMVQLLAKETRDAKGSRRSLTPMDCYLPKSTLVPWRETETRNCKEKYGQTCYYTPRDPIHLGYATSKHLATRTNTLQGLSLKFILESSEKKFFTK